MSLWVWTLFSAKAPSHPKRIGTAAESRVPPRGKKHVSGTEGGRGAGRNIVRLLMGRRSPEAVRRTTWGPSLCGTLDFKKTLPSLVLRKVHQPVYRGIITLKAPTAHPFHSVTWHTALEVVGWRLPQDGDPPKDRGRETDQVQGRPWNAVQATALVWTNAEQMHARTGVVAMVRFFCV